MIPFAGAFRGLSSRAGSNAMVLLVAVVAVAAAAAGPAYYSASQRSILLDSVARAPVIGRGFEVTQSGSVSGTLQPLEGEVEQSVSGLGSFHAPIEAIEGTGYLPALLESFPIVWRTDVCAHLRVEGACPTAKGQVMASRSLAAANHWTVGQPVTVPDWGTLTVTGIYGPPPRPVPDYWFDRECVYFPVEFASECSRSGGSPGGDALFTPRSTLQSAAAANQGTIVMDFILEQSRMRTSDVKPLSAEIPGLLDNPMLGMNQAVVTSNIPATLAEVDRGWSSLEVPVVVVSAQLLVLAWLLLFLLVTDSAAARGPEVALAKLRGRGWWRTLSFGLSEPATILAAAFPAGAAAGWGFAVLLGRALLRPGTPVGLPGLGWGAAAAATAGGLAAVVFASRRTLRRPVMDQWRRANRRANDRTWVVDSVLLTAAAAGLGELLVTGTVSSAHTSALGLLVPGLLGLAVAVVASRLLPFASRIAAGGSGRRGGLVAFLSLRHIARRPAGTRTTIMLATAFALATFSLGSWEVDQANYRTLADAQVGAPAVATVEVPEGHTLAGVVARADPSGRRATPVQTYSSQDTTTLAVDPRSWVAIATWTSPPAGYGRQALAAALDPPEPPPLMLEGDEVRVHIDVSRLSPARSDLILDVDTSTSPGSTPVDLGVLPTSGVLTRTAPLAGCPCRVQDFTLEASPQVPKTATLAGHVVFTGAEVHGPSGWKPIDAGFTDASRWSDRSVGESRRALSAGAGGLRWTFMMPVVDSAVLGSVNRPARLPAIASSAITGKKTGPLDAVGLNGGTLKVDVISAVASVPGAPANGVVVDGRYATIAADNNTIGAVQQVWFAPGAAATILPRLRSEGVGIAGVQTAGAAAALLGRQGPGLARVLFLAEAAAAALLAAGGAVLGLYLFARRRRYEMAALAATGLRRRTLLGALASEQLVVVAFGVLVGIGAGLAAMALALRHVPELLVAPPAPALSYSPPALAFAGVLAAVAVVVAAAATAASVTLALGVRLDQLREPPA